MTMTRFTRRAARRRQVLLTREAFLRFVTDRRDPIALQIDPPYVLRPCTCGDVNCHGWRFVVRDGAVSDVSDTRRSSRQEVPMG